MENIVASLVVPIYRNSESIPVLLSTLTDISNSFSRPLEMILVLDGSPDDSFYQLKRRLRSVPLRGKLVLLSRNFGAFEAIRAGLSVASGSIFAVMAADLQEPPELILEFFNKLQSSNWDIVYGERHGREDPWLSVVFSRFFWWIFRRFVNHNIPTGGVDVFGCNKVVRDRILELREHGSSFIGLLFWMGFRQLGVPYERRKRKHGNSAWTFTRKWKYFLDSIFSFSDLPIQLLFWVGAGGMLISILLGITIVTSRLTGAVTVSGYSATAILVLFFGALNCFGLGVVGGYVSRTFDNTKQRPNYIILREIDFTEIEEQ